MDGSRPESLLLDESIKLSNIVYQTASEAQLSDWTTVEKPSVVHLNSNEQLTIKKMPIKQYGNSLDSTNKGLRRRFSPNINSSQCRETFTVKFEHFASSSDFIKQYRNAKLLQLEKAFQKILEDNSSRISNDSHTKNVDSNVEKTVNKDVCRPSSSETSCTKTEQSDMVSGTGQNGDKVYRPSLPQSGYFTGKKWACPKPVYTRPHRPYIEAKRSVGPRFCTKKSQVQVFDTKNMCLKGTGKPIINNKTWAVPRKVACKSAPTTGQRTWTNLLSPRIKSQVVDISTSSRIPKSQKQTDFSLRRKEPNANSFVQRNSVNHLSKVERTSEQDSTTGQQCLEYENMFQDVIRYYKQPKQNSRSHVCVRIGT